MVGPASRSNRLHPVSGPNPGPVGSVSSRNKADGAHDGTSDDIGTVWRLWLESGRTLDVAVYKMWLVRSSRDTRILDIGVRRPWLVLDCRIDVS